jgi:hypothetical protein
MTNRCPHEAFWDHVGFCINGFSRIEAWPTWLGCCFVICLLSGCASPPPPPEHAVMPSIYIDNLPVKRISEGEEVYLSPDSILIDKTSHVWLKADAPRIKEPHPTDRFIKVFRQGGECLIITCNIPSFSVCDEGMLEGCKAPEKLRVAKLVVKTSVNDLASLTWPSDSSTVQSKMKTSQVAQNRRGL